MTKNKKYTITNWDDVSEDDIDELRDENRLTFHHETTAVMGKGPTLVLVYAELHLEESERRKVLNYFPEHRRASLTKVNFIRKWK